jgi:hypothetical protein
MFLEIKGAGVAASEGIGKFTIWRVQFNRDWPDTTEFGLDVSWMKYLWITASGTRRRTM